MRKPKNDSTRFSRRMFLQLSALGGASLLAGCQNSAIDNSNTQTRATSKTDSPSITHRQIQTNGINMHIAEAGKGLPVIFLHGFSELWNTWRNQLPAVAAAGFHAVAPDQRGYGQTDAPPGTVEYLFMQKRAGTGLLKGMPNPEKLPAWLTEADLDYSAKEFSRTGFRGGLNWYRNMDMDWSELPKIGTTGINQPVSYMGGRRDPSVIYAPFDQMISAAPKLRKIVFLEGCGHWVQLERPDEVNKELIEFLGREIK